MKLFRNFFLVAAALTALLAPAGSLFTPNMAIAQSFGQRVIEGKVVDGDNSVLTGAIVFLKNLKTKAIRSYTTTPDGGYRFTQVGMVDDYELWSEKSGKKSQIKSISSYDTRKQFEVELHIK